MNRYLLDTNALSEGIKPRPNSGYIAWLKGVDSQNLHTSSLCMGEIQIGINALSDDARSARLSSYLNDLMAAFDDKILPIDTETITIWASITAAARTNGHPIDAIDALIAAQALQHKLTLVTRNTKDFRYVEGLLVLSPWE